jgi:hypothetical protein
MRTFGAELAFRGIKIIDIGFVTALYFLLGIFSARAFDNFYGKYDAKKEDKKSMLRQTLEIIGMMWLYGVIIYMVRNLVELIPSPFDGLYSFKHSQLKELKNASVYTFVFLFFQLYFKDKLVAYYNKLKV